MSHSQGKIMQETLYKLIFEGKIQPDHKEKAVRKNLQALLKTDKEKIDRLFSGKPIVIRKNLPEGKIRPYEKAMVKAGAVCRILSVKGEQELPPSHLEALKAFEGHDNSTPADPPIVAAPEEKPAKRASFHWANRIGRTQFLALLWLAGWFEVLAWFLPDYLPQLTGSLTVQESLMISTGLHTLAGISFILIVGLRLHDINRTAWLWIFMLIPGLNLLLMLWLSLARGNNHWNSFGAIPAEPGKLAKLFGLWLPLLMMVSSAGSAWFHQDELLQLASTLPEEIMQFSEF